MDIPTKAELARQLQSVSAERVARVSGLSQKTIYRYRWGKSSPSVENLRLVLAALQEVAKEASA